MNEINGLARPEVVDQAAWEILTPGEKVRMLRRAEELVPLPVHVYRKLRRLPGWVFYGPEHGLPPDWVDAQGLLAEAFRPGGAEHELFRLWRREYRVRRWIGYLLRERWRSRWRRAQPWAEPMLWGAAILIGFDIFDRLARGYGQLEKLGWAVGLMLASALIVQVAIFVSGWLGAEANLASWCAAWTVRRWERRPTRGGGAGRTVEERRPTRRRVKR